MNKLMEQEVQERIAAFVAKSKIPHLQVGLWCQGETHISDFGSAVNPSVDVFEIGSVGKTFTASLLAILDEQGVVSIKDSVARFKPELPFAESITLFDLATHTSGLPSNPFKGLILNPVKAVSGFTAEDYDKALSGIKTPLKAGKFSYSNQGMALLGNILADHLGMTYEDAVKKHLLQPLGMHDTHVSGQAYEPQRLATGHNGEGVAMPPFKWPRMEPAGLWRSTTSDMLTFLKAHLGHAGDAWQNTLNRCASPAFSDKKRAGVGLGWQISHSDERGLIPWHNGQTFGQKSVAMFAKDRDCALIMLSNKVPRLWQYFIPSHYIERLGLGVLKSKLGPN